MWRVIVPNALKVAVTKFPRADADALFSALRAMATDPLSGETYALGIGRYYRVVGSYLVFFDLIEANHTVNVVAIERPH